MKWRRRWKASIWQLSMVAVMLAAHDGAICFSESLENMPCDNARAVICVPFESAIDGKSACPVLGFTLEMYPGGFFRPPQAADWPVS